jgi:hypothetical protein
MQDWADPAAAAAAAVAFDVDGVLVPAAIAHDPETSLSPFLTIELNARQTLLSNCWAGPNTATFFLKKIPLSTLCWAAGPNLNC